MVTVWVSMVFSTVILTFFALAYPFGATVSTMT